MLNAIFIGDYDSMGVFKSDNWIKTINWLSNKYNEFNILTQMDLNVVKNMFGELAMINQENSLDPSTNYNNFICKLNSIKAWELLLKTSFDINKGITHVYILHNNKCKGQLEVEDSENVLFLDLSKEEERLLGKILDVKINIWECEKRADFIDYLADNEEWKPLGK
jgi:hypothetical protein